MTTRKILTAVSIVIISMLLTASGCNGEKGDAGATGATGAAGAAGTNGVNTIPPTNTMLNPYDNLPGVVIAITGLSGGTGTGGNFKVGDTIKVTFTVKKNDGTYLPATELNSSSIYVSGPTTNYQRVFVSAAWHTAATLVLNSDNTYTYTFPTAIPATYSAPYNDTATFTAGELTGQALQDGTYTIGMQAYKYYYVNGTSYRDVGNVEKDFLLGNAVAIEAREVVKQDNCNKCHVTLQAHGGSRRDVKLCILCHTAGAEDKNVGTVENGTPDITVEFKVMIHKLHNGKHLPSVRGVTTNADGSRNYAAAVKPYTIVGYNNTVMDFSEVAFPAWPNFNVTMPRDYGYSALSGTGANGSTYKTNDDEIRKGVTDCDKCHDGASQETLAYTQPSRRACGACHDDIDWTKPYVANNETMPAQSNDSSCALCHPGTGANPGATLDVVVAHKHPFNNPAINTGLNVSITAITGGTGAGGNFQAGDSPSITFTVKNDAGADVSLGSLDSSTLILMGPTTNRQVVLPQTSANGMSISPFDSGGRLSAISATNKGSMSKGVGAIVTEALMVEFTSATAFNVNGATSGNLGAGALPASPSTNPSGSSISSIQLDSTSVAENITISFSSASNFTVTGTVTGAMGSGTLPATTSGSTRFVSTNGKFAFNITVGTTVFAAGNNIYVTVFKGAVANPVIFAVVAGRTSFTGTAPTPDRFYYETIASAANYTIKVPMDIYVEYIGDGTGVVGQQLTAANLPVYFGRQTLYEVTALGAAKNPIAATAMFERYIDVVNPGGFANSDYVIIDKAGTATQRECAQIGYVEALTGVDRLWFKNPLRFAHTAASTVQKATMTQRQEGVLNQYSLNSTTGVVTSSAGAAWGAGNAVIMTYRTDGKFGWKLNPGGAAQAVYFPPANGTDDLDETWADWTGKAFADGTYTIALWGYKNIELAVNNEINTYRGTSVSATKDFLYGATATTIVPHTYISSANNCYACHNDLLFHGGGRRGFDACVFCHSTSGAEDNGRFNATNALETKGTTIDFRTMLHKIHMGAELANADTYVVIGNQGSQNMYDEVEFPPMPGKAKHCTVCHGATNTSWKEPTARNHPTSQTNPARVWRSVCSSCHDSDEAGAHFNAMTDNGTESCAVCHEPGADFNVELMHKNR